MKLIGPLLLFCLAGLPGCVISSSTAPAQAIGIIVDPLVAPVRAAPAGGPIGVAVRLGDENYLQLNCRRVERQLAEVSNRFQQDAIRELGSDYSRKPGYQAYALRYWSSPEVKRVSEQHTECWKAGMISGSRDYEALAAVLLSSALSRIPGLSVYPPERERQRKGPARYEARLGVTKFVEKIEAEEHAQEGLVQEVGHAISLSVPYVSLGASMVLAPLGGLLAAFEPVTGLPTSWGSDRNVGLVMLEARLTDLSNGTVIASFPLQAIFGTVENRFGGFFGDLDIGSGHYWTEMISRDEAIRAAAGEAALKIADELAKRH